MVQTGRKGQDAVLVKQSERHMASEIRIYVVETAGSLHEVKSAVNNNVFNVYGCQLSWPLDPTEALKRRRFHPNYVVWPQKLF